MQKIMQSNCAVFRDGPGLKQGVENLLMRQLLSFFAGSLSNVNQGSWITDPTNVDTFSDYKNFDHRIRDMHNQNEASIFFKDDWKVLPSLTLNLGARWAYFSVPWESDGLMPLPVGGGDAMFGISGRSWDGWMRPGHRSDPTVLQFVGKGSPNPGTPWYPDDWNNFGPAVGFAWQVPWFGDKTTIRGGFQRTYGKPGAPYTGGLLSGPGADGNSTNTYSVPFLGRAANLTDLPLAVPAPPSRAKPQDLVYRVGSRSAVQSMGRAS